MNHTHEFAVKILNRLQAEHAKWEVIKKLGFEKSDYEESLTDLLEESLARLLAGDDEAVFEIYLECIQEFVYNPAYKAVFKNRENEFMFSGWLTDSCQSEN